MPKIKIFLANGIFFLTGLTVKCMKVFRLHCLCLGLVAFSAVSMRAKEIKVTFDAGKYQKGEDWGNFIADLCETLKKTPNYEKDDTFYLKVQNGDIFGVGLPKKIGFKVPTGSDKTFSKVLRIEVDAEVFSTSSLMKVFPQAKTLRLPNAKYIFGFLETISREIILKGEYKMEIKDEFERKFVKKFEEELQIIHEIAKEESYPELESVFAPEVTLIGNAAFFNFQKLEHVNDQEELIGDSKPAIVCTTLAENYFDQNFAPKSALISPVTVTKFTSGKRRSERLKIKNEEKEKKGEKVKYKEKFQYEYKGNAVAIGSCAFQRCFALQHVSAHACFIGSAAFAASGLKSAHLLLSSPVDSGSISDKKFSDSLREARWLLLRPGSVVPDYLPYFESRDYCDFIAVGYDVFFNCFELKECFMMFGQANIDDSVFGTFEGCFWNCFGLETVCMPNIRFHSRAMLEDTQKREGLTNSMFMNAFSLKNLDIRGFNDYSYEKLIPTGVTQHNHFLLACEHWGFASSFWASFEGGCERSNANRYPQRIRDLVKKVCGPEINEVLKKYEHKDDKMPGIEVNQLPCRLECVFFDPEYIRENSYFGNKVLPCMDCEPIHMGNHCFHTLIETRIFSPVSGKPPYEDDVDNIPPAFLRFNDAYSQWFVKENKSEEKPKNDLLNKKRKCPFVVHGG